MKNQIFFILSFLFVISLNINAQINPQGDKEIMTLEHSGNDLQIIQPTTESNMLIISSPQGELFVNINNNHRIMHYHSDGTLAATIEVEGEVSHMAANSNGDLFVNINNNHRILHFNKEGVLYHDWKTEGNITSLSVDDEGRVFVNINNNHHIIKYNYQGEELGMIKIN